VSDSKKFGTRDPAPTALPGSASTFYVSGSVFEYLRWLEEIPGPMLPNRARAWTRLRDGWRSRDAPSGSTRNTLATLEVWRGTECTHFHERAYPNSAVGSCSATAGGFAKPLRGGAGDVGRYAPANGLLEKADESCWFFSRTSAASSFRTGCPCARARRTRTMGEPTAIGL
jgi:hypothetical protein